MSCSPLVNNLVKNRLFQESRPHQTSMSRCFNSSTLCIYLSVVRHDAARQPKSRNPQDWDLGCLEATGRGQESLAFEIAACIADLFSSFCEEVYVVAFSSAAKKLPVKWEIQPCVCGQIISVCNSERIVNIRDHLPKLCSNEKASSFLLTHSVYIHRTCCTYPWSHVLLLKWF